MSLNWLLPIRGRRRKKSPRPTRWAQTQLRVEPLEERTLLSVGVGLSVRNGVATLAVNDNAANHVGVEKPDGVYRFSVDSGVWQTQPWQVVNKVVITTAGGDDQVIVGASVPVQVTVKAGNGNDGVFGFGPGKLIVYGGTGNDWIQQNGTGVLLAYGENGHDTIIGGPNNDIIYGGNHNDVLKGMAGNDKLYGQGGFDTIYAGAGFDYVDGACGQVDVYYVTPGQDRWVLDNRRGVYDIVYRFDPTDVAPPWTTQNGTLTVDWRQETSGAVIRATGPSSWEIQWNGSVWTLTGVSHFVFHGSAYGDSVDGTLFQGTTEMYGNGGSDTLRGGQARDVLFGGDGNDWLYGNAGNDDLTGNAGNDLHDGGAGADLLDAIDGVFGNDPLVFDGLDTVLRDPGGVLPNVLVVDDHTGDVTMQSSVISLMEVDMGVGGVFYSVYYAGVLQDPHPIRANGDYIDITVADTLGNLTFSSGLETKLVAAGVEVRKHTAPGGGGNPNFG